MKKKNKGIANIITWVLVIVAGILFIRYGGLAFLRLVGIIMLGSTLPKIIDTKAMKGAPKVTVWVISITFGLGLLLTLAPQLFDGVPGIGFSITMP